MQNILLFDFDGVVVDSFELSYQAAVDAGSPLTREQQKKIFEGNFYDVIKKLKRTIAPQDEEKFYLRYTPALLQTPPMQGIGESLHILKEQYKMCIVSSIDSRPILQYLKGNNFNAYFFSVLGGDVHKSKIAKINMVLDKQNAEPADCVFITDTLGDINEAAKCNVQSIGVTWGFHEQWRLEKGKPFAIINTVQELVPVIHTFFADKS